MNYGQYLAMNIEVAMEELDLFDSLANYGTLEDKVQYLFDLDPSLRDKNQIHALLFTYWSYFDGLEEVDELLEVTPAESITRTRRKILETEREMVKSMNDTMNYIWEARYRGEDE